MRIQFRPATTAFAALMISGMAAPAPAQQNAQADAVANAAGPGAPPAKKICRRIDRTGTHMRERVCLTREEWRKVEEYLERNP